jgi:hypothetical protein
MSPADPGPPLFSFSGFGTLGEVHSNDDRADFTSSLFKPTGAGYTHSWSADVDSLIAGQVTATFSPKFSAVLQVISEQSYNNTYTPQVEWANIKYQFTPDFSIRAGRTVLPCFFLSDTRNVGYTYAWVRPPVEVYHLLPVATSDGLDVSYRSHLGELADTIQLNAGGDTTHLTDNGGDSLQNASCCAKKSVNRRPSPSPSKLNTAHVSFHSSSVTSSNLRSAVIDFSCVIAPSRLRLVGA